LRLQGLALRSVPDSGTITKYFALAFRLPRFWHAPPTFSKHDGARFLHSDITHVDRTGWLGM
jgi:hypothetical protein